MTVHLGILALMIAVAGGALLRLRRVVKPPTCWSLALAVAIFASQAMLLLGESGFGRAWEGAARRELGRRVEGIVEFLRLEGAGALEQVRAIGADPGYHALLGSDDVVARKRAATGVSGSPGALSERSARRCHGLRPARGTRAWAGWSPPLHHAALARARSGRGGRRDPRGNICTLLEVVHPVVGAAGRRGLRRVPAPAARPVSAGGRLLRVDDALQRPSSGGGAATALVSRVSEGRRRRPVPAQRPAQARCPRRRRLVLAAILSAAGTPVGRISLVGLSRSAWSAARLAPLARARTVLLCAAGLARGDPAVVRRARPARSGGAARAARFQSPQEGSCSTRSCRATTFDPLGVFDPSWFALDPAARAASLARRRAAHRRRVVPRIAPGSPARAGQEGRVRDFGRRHPAWSTLPRHPDGAARGLGRRSPLESSRRHRAQRETCRSTTGSIPSAPRQAPALRRRRCSGWASRSCSRATRS